TLAAHVLHDLGGRIDMVIDGGPTSVGLESTIIACPGEPMLLRPGGLPRAAIEQALGHGLADPPQAARVPNLPGDEDAPLAPGMLASHYAPRARLRLDAREVRPGEALLAFGGIARDAAGADLVLNLSAHGDLVEAAANLFS